MNSNYKSAVELARAIKDSVRIREASYDKSAADAATEDFNKKVADSSSESVTFPFVVDYAAFYTKTLQQACEEGAGELSTPVYLLLFYSWNDALDWADEVLEITTIKD